MFDLDNKPDFKYNQRVYSNLPNCVGFGTIKGKASSHLIDFWIVEMDDFPPNWEYKSVSIPHSYLI